MNKSVLQYQSYRLKHFHTVINNLIIINMKNITILAALLISFQVFSQSIKEGVDESKFGTVAASDFDFAGVWQANRYEVVYDRELQKVVLFEFRDSITDIVFIRTTGSTYPTTPFLISLDSVRRRNLISTIKE